MNQFRFELKSQIKGNLMWAIAIIGVLFGFMYAIYPLFQDGAQAFQKVVEGFPPKFAEAFGLRDILNVMSYGGYYSFCNNYFALMGAIMAGALGMSLFAREKKAKCLDFLLTRPMRREAIFAVKLAAGLVVLIVFNLLFQVAALIIGTKNEMEAGTLILASSALFWMQLVFYSIAVFYAVFAKKIRSVAGMATALGFAGFIISAIENMIDEKAIRFISPLRYYDPADVFKNGGFEVKYAAVGILVIIVCIAASFYRFCKSDAHAV